MKIYSYLMALVLAGALVSCRATYVVHDRPREVVYNRPPAPSANHVWVSGNWVWIGGRYQWREGHWETRHTGRIWVEGRWVSSRGGWRWQPGHWAHY